MLTKHLKNVIQRQNVLLSDVPLVLGTVTSLSLPNLRPVSTLPFWNTSEEDSLMNL